MSCGLWHLGIMEILYALCNIWELFYCKQVERDILCVMLLATRQMQEFHRLIGMWHSAEFVLLLWQVESDTEPPDWLVSDQEEELIRLLSVENLHQSEPTTDIIQLLVA